LEAIIISYFGRIKFFDHLKNHFGYIGEVCSKLGQYGKDVYIDEHSLNGVVSGFTDGQFVSLNIEEGKRRPTGLDVTLLDQESPDYATAILFFEGRTRLTLVEELLRKNKTLPHVLKAAIIRALSQSKDPSAHRLLQKLDETYYENHFDEISDSLDDSQLLSIIEKTKDQDLLAKALNLWGFNGASGNGDLAKLMTRENPLIQYSELKGFFKSLTDTLTQIVNFIEMLDISGMSEPASDEFRGALERHILHSEKDVNCGIKTWILESSSSLENKQRIIDNWDFKAGNTHDWKSNQKYNMILLDLLNSNKSEGLELQILEDRLINNIEEVQIPIIARWAQLFQSTRILEEIVCSLDFLNPSQILPNVKEIMCLTSSYGELLKSLISRMDTPYESFILFALGIDLNINSKAITHFISQSDESNQFYFLQYLVYLYHNGSISQGNLSKHLTDIAWTAINVRISLIFLQGKEVNMAYLRDNLNLIYKSAMINRSVNDLRISSLVSPCSGRVRVKRKGEYKSYGMEFYKYEHGIYWQKSLEEDLFCEGRFWKSDTIESESDGKSIHSILPIYWCRGGTCFKPNNVSNIESDHFSMWTLVELTEIVGNPVDQKFLAIFAGWANRMNEIISRLKCRSCSENLIPEPFEPTNLGFYAVPIFKCENPDCEDCGKQVRLTHCLNGNCTGDNNRIIDSRDCPKCSNGWLVCQDCNACCPGHHDSRTVACKSCGENMQKDEASYSCGKCQHIEHEDNLSGLQSFWSRSTSYEPKQVNRT
jgi:hypothetical protein